MMIMMMGGEFGECFIAYNTFLVQFNFLLSRQHLVAHSSSNTITRNYNLQFHTSVVTITHLDGIKQEHPTSFVGS